jgi:hypothetical protein
MARNIMAKADTANNKVELGGQEPYPGVDNLENRDKAKPACKIDKRATKDVLQTSITDVQGETQQQSFVNDSRRLLRKTGEGAQWLTIARSSAYSPSSQLAVASRRGEGAGWRYRGSTRARSMATAAPGFCVWL